MTPQPEQLNEWITLFHASCEDVLPTLGKVDAVVTDPPYEIRSKYGTSNLYGTRRMEFDFDIEGVTDDVVIPALALCGELANSVHSFCEPEQYAGIAAALRKAGMNPKPWAKIKACPPPPMPGNWWPSAFELAIYAHRPGSYFGDTGVRCNAMRFDSYRHGIRAWEKVDHPTQKWLPMVEYLVRSMTREGDTILDPFAGSGTTGIAAMLTGRKCILIEKDAKYAAMIRKRIREADPASPGKLFAPSNDTSLFAEANS